MKIINHVRMLIHKLRS
uniref:Uncharacterized protein n=1 Tax=Anguilla anguilla TaxID=7936 RepID=A0A0E9XJW0_ANGAN